MHRYYQSCTVKSMPISYSMGTSDCHVDRFLALERSVPKDKMGRINYYHVAEVGCRFNEHSFTIFHEA
jgi:hypothetical protein